MEFPRGSIFFPSDFLDLGTSEAIRLYLFRFERQGLIVRVAQGIYVCPRESRVIGKIIPSAEEVAEAISRRDRTRVLPSGGYALNLLGLSTQVPLNIVVLTDGSARVVRVGNRSICYKKTSPKNLLAKGRISRLVIQALKEIGNGKITAEAEKKIVKHLRKERVSDLEHDIKLAPVWIRKIMIRAMAHVKD